MKKITFSLSAIRITVLSLIIGIGMFFSTSTFAAVITYGSTTGNWSDANWTPQAPVAGDDVVIPAGAIVTLSSDAGIKLNSLSVLGTLLISANGILSVEQTVTVNPLVNIGGGDIENAGTLSIKQTLAASNAAIILGNGTDADSKIVNTGTLNIDMLASTISSSTTRCVNFSQTTPSRICRFTLGGTLNFAVPDGTRFFEISSGANAVMDGTAVIGSTTDYKNWRLIHMGNKGTLTVAGNIDFYSGYVSSANGTISMSTSASGSAIGNLIVTGALKLHGGPTVTGSGLYLNPQYSSTTVTSGTSNFTNQGTLIIEGNFPMGNVFLNGSTGTATNFNNIAGATATLTNSTNSGTAVPFRATTSQITTFINAGTLNLSSADLDVTINTAKNTYTNTGVVNFNYNYVAGVKQLTEFNGKIFSKDNEIIVNLPANEKAQFILFDVTGRNLKTVNLQAEKNTIATHNLKGIFIVRLLTAEGNYSQKISLN